MPRTAATVDALVPRGWTIEARRGADFNGDGRIDVLLLLRDGASTPMPHRILVVAVRTARPAGYRVVGSNAEFIPFDASGDREDPMADGSMIVRRGGFDVSMSMVSGAGSYLAARMKYRFRWSPSCVQVIGYDRNEIHRGTLDTNDVSVNLLTGAVIRTQGNAGGGRPSRERSQLAARPRICLQDLPSGWTFDPTADALSSP